MNELIFFAHLFTLLASLLGALKLGKEALVGLICVLAVLMNIFVLKQITLFGLTVTATDAFAVSVTLGFNLLQEYYGIKITRQAIWISFYVSIVALILSTIHVWYLPSVTDIYHCHFESILSVMPRIVIASLTTYIIVMQVDALIYKALKKRFGSSHMVLRNYASIAFSQLLDTLLFSFLGLWGMVPYLSHIILVSYTIKIITIFCITPLIAVSKHIIPIDKMS
jgi:uncharacterized integral membrane protein (TIGR00697 family)